MITMGGFRNISCDRLNSIRRDWCGLTPTKNFKEKNYIEKKRNLYFREWAPVHPRQSLNPPLMTAVIGPEAMPSAHEASAVAMPIPIPEGPATFRSRLPDIDIDNHLPLHDYCFHRLPELADSPCLIAASTGEVYSYAEAYSACRRAAGYLSSKCGVGKGDVVMLLLQNCPELPFAIFGASMLGAVSTTANPSYTRHEIAGQLRRSGARAVVTQSRYADKLAGADVDVVVVVATELLSAEELPRELFADVGPEDAVVMPFSSGTTGLPKGVVLSHRSVVSSIAQQVDGENPNVYLRAGEDVMLCALPMFHIFSLSCMLLSGLRAGAAMVIVAKVVDVERTLEVIERFRVTAAAMVPPMVLALAKDPVVEKYDLGSLRIVLSGAAPLGKVLEAALQDRLPQAVVGQGYGMTESGPVITMCPGFAKQPTTAKSGSSGIVARNTELKVLDPETGFSLGRNQPGEICIRGPQIMKGYLNDPDATSATIDLEGWLHTGDIGYVDDDDEVFIVDRVKELIKFNGFSVAPAELEGLLLSHPSISDAAVVPQKDEVAGEVPVAFVVLSKDLKSEITEKAIKVFIAKQVVLYKRLHKVYFISAIPKSPTGKILRKELRARAASC